jgi:biopolymer transport protein TolQ
VWGVMDSFAAMSEVQGNVGLQAMAPGICSALITTVVGLLVAIPSMFGYNLLVTRIRAMVVRLDNFVSELCGVFDRHYVEHSRSHGYEVKGSLGREPTTAAAGSPILDSPMSVPPFQMQESEPSVMSSAPVFS